MGEELEKPTQRVDADKRDRIEVLKILVLMVVSFVIGFGLVYIAIPSGDKKARQEQVASASETKADDEVRATSEAQAIDTSAEQEKTATDEGRYAPAGSGEGFVIQSDTGTEAKAATEIEDGDTEGEAKAEVFNEGEAKAEVPPGPTPAGVSLDGEAFYLKCWDSNGSEIAGPSCDRLKVLEKRLSTRLYVVDKCKNKYAAGVTKRKLSLGMDVDFKAMSSSFWSGVSSDIDKATNIASCIRQDLAGLPIGGFEHNYSRYRIFFTVLFGGSSERPAVAQRSDSVPPAEDRKISSKGKTVNVTKDRVRVRKTPENGEIIGNISSGNQVRLLQMKNGWCRVVTPNNNEGWMSCDALGL